MISRRKAKEWNPMSGCTKIFEVLGIEIPESMA